MTAAGNRPSATVVVCTWSHAREPLLRACVQSVLAGSTVPDEILVVVDDNPSLEAQIAGWMPSRIRLLRSERPGLSGGRNAGARAATSDIVVFIDDDATAEPEWLSSLLEPFVTYPEVIGVGGSVLPEWETDRRWLPDELLWLVGCTYKGHREDPGPIRNPIGCNMAFRRRELVGLDSFAAGFGRPRNMYCDETELGLRLAHTHGPGRIRFVPTARVHHHVPAARLAPKVLAGRCVREGLSKGRLQRLYPGVALSNERGYARQLVGSAAPTLLLHGIRGRDGKALLGAVAILGALLITAVAFVAGAARAGRRS